MHYLSQYKKKDLVNKTALLRVDFNVEKKTDTFRIDSSLPSILFLKKSGAKTLLLSHRGRPDNSSKDKKEFSLQELIPYLERKIKTKIVFFSDLDTQHIRSVIEKSKPGSVFLLENLRYFPEEEKNSVPFAKKLASFGDLYINDAFANSHRKHASIYALAGLLPASAGIQLELEVKTLTKVMQSPKKPLALILGGAKTKDKIGVIRYFLHTAKDILLGGGVANTLLAAEKFPIGDSVYDPSSMSFAKKLLQEEKIILPIDFIQAENKLLDIGPLSIDIFKEHLSSAKTVIWNGPLGLFERKAFARGSEEIARFLARRKGFVVIGGGETVSLIRSLKLEKKFGFLSTGGGAMLAFLSGETLPGIQILERKQ